MPKEDKATETR